MHAYLFSGPDVDEVTKKVADFISDRKLKAIEFHLETIGQVRDLKNFVKLAQDANTIILIKNIDHATVPACNAFLKTLEEPQKNVQFILTASSVHSILPTIVSRCQVVKVTSSKRQVTRFENLEKFLSASVGGKLATIDKIRGREEALSFIENIIYQLHGTLHHQDKDLKTIAQNLEFANFTLSALKANGNVGLQLTNFTLNYVN